MGWYNNPLIYSNIDEGDLVSCGEDAWVEQPATDEYGREALSEDDVYIMDIIEQEVRHTSPERNLAAAIFLMALADVARDPMAVFSVEMQDAIVEAKSAYRWFETDDFKYIFSFRNICKELSICAFKARKVARSKYSQYVLDYLVSQSSL